MGYFEILLLVHIFGAVIGFGPAFAFPILGPLSGKLQGPQAIGILKGIVAIQRRLIIPTATVVQPLTGVLLIFETQRNRNFFDHEWLWIAILLYIATYYMAILVQRPNIEKIIELAESGGAGSEEFVARVAKTRRLGPFIGLSLATIVFLMITKPGAPDSFF